MSRRKIIERAVTGITRELTDRGKLVEAGFAAFQHLVIQKDAPPIQVDEMRLAWMAGAEYLFYSIMDILDPGEEPTDADMHRMDLIHEELETWKAMLAARILPTKGNA